MPDLTGEQKLRIVLESIIRKIPKEEQCQKYGISEEDFLGWQEHLTQNGGKIFEPGFGRTSRRVKTVKEMGKASKFFFILSILINLALTLILHAIILVQYYFLHEACLYLYTW